MDWYLKFIFAVFLTVLTLISVLSVVLFFLDISGLL